MVFTGYLSLEEIHRLHEVAIQCGLAGSISTLRSGMPLTFVAGFEEANAPATQLLNDLSLLNATEKLVDGTIPFEVWLRNAKMLTKLLPQSVIFNEALQRIDAKAPCQ